jgi:hypothetical protein
VSGRRSHNLHLAALPSDREFLRAVLDIETENRERHLPKIGASASHVAYRLNIQGASRLGNGAVKGSWSGRMSGSLRAAPRLRALTKRGLLREHWGDRRIEWALTPAGKEALDG